MKTSSPISLSIDGRVIKADHSDTILTAAKKAGIEIPVLCHDSKLKPVGVCRLCVVDTGERVLPAACVRKCENEMVIETKSPKVEKHRAMLLDLLMSDQIDPRLDPKESTIGGNELFSLARDYGASGLRFKNPELDTRGKDDSSQVISVDHQACILCDRCIRACDDIQGNEVMGRSGKGYLTRIAFDLNIPMGESTCVSCGECAAACPTGALVDKAISSPIRPRELLTSVDSVCPYCGVGCALTYHVDHSSNKIVMAEGRESPGNQGRLCVKGRYGWDYAHHEQRLKVPLIRKESAYPKSGISDEVRGGPGNRGKPGGIVNYDDVLPAFREATWDEALDLVAAKFLEIRNTTGPESLAGFGSAKCSNEEAYLFQKFIRVAFGTNNIDHCTRLCHASSVAALLEGIGSGAVTTTYGDIENADVALLAGTNTTANHPVAASFFKEAHKRGTKLIVVDPRRSSIADHADYYCRIKPGTDVAFYNGLMNIILKENLEDRTFINERTNGIEELEKSLEYYSPERASAICGIDSKVLIEISRLFGKADAAVVYWGMGISQHVYGTNNARCLISLALLTGNIGKPGSGLHPLRGQNNVQGASDAGLVPMVFPDYQSVEDPEIRGKFESAWNCKLDPNKGLTVVEITKGALEGKIQGMYIMGENPFLSDPNVNKVRKALSNLSFLAVQDIFLTETAEFADVILPASSYLEKLGTYTNTDRRVQIGRPALEMPGEARLDWKIISDVARRMGYPMEYASPEAIFEEFSSLTDSYQTLDYQTLGSVGKLWPNPNPAQEDGPKVLFDDTFPTDDGRARFVAADWTAAPELPSNEFPFILNTGRLLEHWHTGSMTRRSQALHNLSPTPFVGIHPEDAHSLGIKDGEKVQVASARGSIELEARLTKQECKGAVFVPFHFREAAANLLTIDAIDPDGKIPEFKFCAVRVNKVRNN